MSSADGPKKLNQDEVLRLYAALIGGPIIITFGVFLVYAVPLEAKVSQYFSLFLGAITHPFVLTFWIAYCLFIICQITYFVLRPIKQDPHSSLGDDT